MIELNVFHFKFVAMCIRTFKDIVSCLFINMTKSNIICGVIVKILNLYIILSCTHLYYFFPVSILLFKCFAFSYFFGFFKLFWLFRLFVWKRLKSIFLPAFGVHSTQMMVAIYNTNIYPKLSTLSGLIVIT